MKKLITRLLLVACITSFFVGCSKLDNAEPLPETQTVSVGLKFAKNSNITKSGNFTSGTEEPAPPSCTDEIAQTGYIEFTYEGTFYDENDVEITSSSIETTTIGYAYDANNTNTTIEANTGLGNMATISDLMQFDYPTESNVAYLKLSITSFAVYDQKDASTRQLLFATPNEGSAYEHYVTTPLTYTENIDLYEKQYINMDVLCIDEETIPLFGFAWTDFNIITVNEVCMFFNCMGTTAATRHQVYAADFTAYFKTGYGEEADWTLYWEGENYTVYEEESMEQEAEIVPFCIPVPANWRESGMMLELRPLGSTTSTQTITLTPEQIEAFLDREPNKMGSLGEGETGYTLSLDFANEVPYLHYTFDDCQKPIAYYANITGTIHSPSTTLYGVNLDEQNIPTATPFFNLPGYTGHIAISPDETKIVIGNTDDPLHLTVLDLYTLKSEELVEVTGRTGPAMGGMPDYDFVQYVYIENQLYAGCKENGCLVPIDFVEGGFMYGPDLDDPNVAPQILGGDLLAADAEGSADAVYKDHTLFTFAGDRNTVLKFTKGTNGTLETSYTGDLTPHQLSGTAVLWDTGSNFAAITSHNNNSKVYFKVWINGTIEGQYEMMDTDWGGDMASSWNNNVTVTDIISGFGLVEQ